MNNDLEIVGLRDELVSILKENITNLREKGIAARDFSNILSAMEKINKQVGESELEKWIKKLQEVVPASDAIERLAFTGEAADFEKEFGCHLIFDSKKKVVLA